MQKEVEIANEDILHASATIDEEYLKRSPFVDFAEICLKKERTKHDILLAILELTVGEYKFFFGHLCPSTYDFWSNILSIDINKVIFTGFSAKKLQNYYKRIITCHDLVKFIDVVQLNKSFINEININISSTIGIINSFIKDNIEDNFNDYASKLIKDKKRKKSMFQKGLKVPTLLGKKKKLIINFNE